MFCQYKNILGIPGQGIHSYRLFDFAIVDVVMTIVGAYFISKGIKRPFWKVLLALFLFGIFAHYTFCVETTVSKLLF